VRDSRDALSVLSRTLDGGAIRGRLLVPRDGDTGGGPIMARVRTLDIHEVDDEIKAICADAERQTGTSASARTLAHHAPLVKALAAFRTALGKESVVEPTLKELTRLRIARLNACHY
jgi:hypothetical protein